MQRLYRMTGDLYRRISGADGQCAHATGEAAVDVDYPARISPAWPIDHQSFDAIALFQPEGHRQFGLRQITGSTLNQSRLHQAPGKYTHCRANPVPVRLCSHQAKTDAAIPAELIIAIQVRGPVVSRKQQIEIAVAVEVGICKPAADFRLVELSANFCGNLAKASPATIQEELGRLRISHVAANVADGLVDVSVGDGEVEPAIQVHVQKNTAETKAVPRCNPYTRLWRDVFETLAAHAVESDHFVVKVRDGNPRRT